MDKKGLMTNALDVAFLAGEIPQTPEPLEEHHVLGDRRRFDFAWPDRKVAVEVHGGVFSSGRHIRGRGFIADRAKMRAAILAGWIVLEFTTTEFEEDCIACAKQISQALEMRA